MTELISNTQELYKFLATPGIEVVNLLFASDHVVWISWKYAAEGKIPNLLHTNEVIGSYVTAALGFISMLISTSCKRELFTQTPTPSYTYKMTPNPL